MAEDDDQDSKTEDPTDRKLDKAKEEGSIAQSQEIKSLATMVSLAMIVALFLPWLMPKFQVLLTKYLADGYAFPVDFEHIQLMVADLFADVGLLLALPIGLIAVVALAASVGQTGLIWSPKKLKPNVQRFSPVKGAKKIFSANSVVEFVKSLIKLVIVATVLGVVVVPQLSTLLMMPSMSIHGFLGELRWYFLITLIVVVALMGIIAVADFLYQDYTFKKQQRMTKQEVKDEHKSSEGDPQVKARIAQIRNARARQRMMAAVPTADVVITNPTHYAVALDYKMEEMDAPKLVAKGVDNLAAKIREVAEEHGVPIVENPPLARALHATVELDQEIPPEHYKAVAEVIGYVMRLKGKLPH